MKRFSNCRKPEASRLTLAEKKVLELLTLAKSNKEIGAILSISTATVKRHVENLFRKLGAKNRVEAAIYGLLISGCAGEGAGICPLESWRQSKAADADEWAILPIDRINGRML